MKKFTILILLILGFIPTVQAQKSTGIATIDEMLKCAPEIATQAAKMFAEYGVKADVRLTYDEEQRQLIYWLRFFDREIYDGFNLQAAASGAVRGMLLEAVNADESGNGLEQITMDFKKNNISMVIRLVYVHDDGHRDIRQVVIKPEQIQSIASLLY